MCYFLASGGNLLWVVVWLVVVINYGLCVANGGNLLVILCRMEVIYYGSFCGEC